jgi:hypothetical protein
MKDFGRMFGFNNPPAADVSTEPSEPEIKSTDCRILLEFRPTVWADMANAVWALQQKSCDPATSERKDEFRAIARHIDRLLECLEEIGVEIQSHTSQTFDSGLSLDVIAFQPTAGISREVVVETIRPTIYLKGHRIQIGQVIVATPERPGENNH